MSFDAQKTEYDALPTPSLHCPAAPPARSNSGNPTAIADAAGDRGNRFIGLAPVDGIDPVDGWVLMTDEPRRTLRNYRADFFARGPSIDVLLDVSPFRGDFTWTQARFAWFVRQGFPAREGIAPWTNRTIDARMAASMVIA